MKNYFNKQEQQQMTFAVCLIAQMLTMQREWKEYDNLTDEEDKLLDSAIASVAKAINTIARRFPMEQQRRLTRCAEENQLYLRPKYSAQIYTAMCEKEIAENKKAGVWIETDIAESLADLLLYKCCKPCCQDVCDRANCPIKSALLLMDIEVCDANASGDKCPYDNGG